MKSTGIVRKIDQLGRVVIPKELRKTLDLHEGTSVEIFTKEDVILLKRFKSNKECMITGVVSDDNLMIADGTYISREGLEIVNQKMNLKNNNED